MTILHDIFLLNRELVSRANYMWLVFSQILSKIILRWEIFLRFS